MQHTLGPELLARLQKHAKPFVDSVDDVIHKALDALESLNPSVSAGPSGPKVFSPDKFPDFTWAKPISITINGTSVKPEWNVLLIKMIEAAAASGLDAKAVKSLLHIPSHVGKHEGPGFRFVETAGLSVQGQSAQRAWDQAIRIAKHIGAEVDIEWEWYDNPKAQEPGRRGTLSFPAAQH